VVKPGAIRLPNLEVRVMFEPNRIASQEMMRAYERLMPSRRRRVGAVREPVEIADRADEISRMQGGGR
jgi:hypothetical protein